VSRLVAAAVGVLVLGGVAIGAWAQARHDDTRSAAALLAAWQSFDGRLVNSRLLGESSEAGLDCFRYQVDARHDRDVICLDARGRLVEVVYETAARASLVSVIPNSGRSPVRLGSTEIARSLVSAGKVEVLDSSLPVLRTAVLPCPSAVNARVLERSPQAAFLAVKNNCQAAATGVRGIAPNLGAFPSLHGLAVGLAGQARKMEATSGAYLLTYPAARPYVIRMRALEARVHALLAALGHPPAGAPSAAVVSALRQCMTVVGQAAGATKQLDAILGLAAVPVPCTDSLEEVTSLAARAKGSRRGAQASSVASAITQGVASARRFDAASAPPRPYIATLGEARRQMLVKLAAYERRTHALRRQVTGP
jgi:hypothetical protein